ncbi:MAG: exodeoxyribonuclease VII small subunit [Galactobacter sp.]
MSTQGQNPVDSSGTSAQDIDQLSYEQARAQLVDVVQRLEAGGAGLEESLALWERGEALAQRCEEWLAGAKARLDAVRGTGEPTTSVSSAQ